MHLLTIILARQMGLYTVRHTVVKIHRSLCSRGGGGGIYRWPTRCRSLVLALRFTATRPLPNMEGIRHYCKNKVFIIELLLKGTVEWQANTFLIKTPY